MMTTWPGNLTEQQFFYYRMGLIASCFVVGFIYINGTRKLNARIAKGQEDEKNEAKKAQKEARKEAKGKQIQNPGKNKGKKRR